MAVKGHLSAQRLSLLLLLIQTSLGADELRLENGGSPCAGRVEIKHQDEWGTVCTFGWDMIDAEVVCRQLGCGSAVRTPQWAHFGEGSGMIWMAETACHGTESALSDCSHEGWGENYCFHLLDAGVICSGHVEARLVGGNGTCVGRVEIKRGDTWGSICDSHFDLTAASVLCNQLQCGTAVSTPGGARFGEGEGPVWTEEFQCVGNESHLFYCPRTPYVDQACSHGNDVGIICSRFRLVNGTSVCSGRVEVQVLGAWGTLCDSRWDLSDANVLCHQLDCGVAVSTPGAGHFGKGTGPVWGDTFHCKGTEAHLGFCAVTALGASQCSHDHDAGVICSGRSESLRLLKGESRCDGRVEISLGGAWGRVLDDEWDMKDASVVCRQLHCGVAESAYNLPKSEQGTGPVGLRGVRCAGHESNLTLCSTSLSESEQAGLTADVGVVCSGSRQLRLVNATGRCAGRVEIYYQGTWGTVCGDSWDLSESNVVCKQLGCGHAIEAAASAHYGEGSGQIWLDGVSCSGNESELWECPSRGWGQHDCRHKEYAGVLCSEFTDLRLVNGDDCSGRLEVFYNGTWGSVCSSEMVQATVDIVCNQLGCGNGGKFAADYLYGRGSGPTWLDRIQCRKEHSSLWECPSKPWDPHSCHDQVEETYITCADGTETTASPQKTETPQRPSPTGGRDMVPIVICIVLGALLCLILIMLGRQVRSSRALRRGSGRYSGPLPDAVYEELDYNLMREKLEMFDRSVSYSEDSMMKLQYYTGDSEEGYDPGSAQGNGGRQSPEIEAQIQEEASPGDLQLDYDSVEEPALNNAHVPPERQETLALAGGVTEDGYDEAGEVPDLAHFPVSGLTGVPAESEENLQTYRDSQIEWSTPWLKSEGIFEAVQDDPAPLPGDTGYDDVEDSISVSSP